MQPSELSVLHVAGIDMHLRLPSILRLRERGVHVSAAGSGDSKQFDELGIPFYHYPLSRGASPLADRHTRERLAEIMSEVRPDVVHSFSTKPCVLVPPVARAAGVPAVLRTVCGLGYLYSTETLKARMMRVPFHMLHKKASKAASFTIFQNDDDRQLFRSKGIVTDDKTTLIPGSGVDIEALTAQIPNHEERDQLRYNLKLQGGPVVIMVSRLVKQKGVDHYLESAREIKKDYPDATFLLVGPVAGEGGQAVSLNTIESYSGDVSYLGYRTDIPTLLSMADVFVLPSRYREGVPRVLMEAAALGLALVSTNMPGCKDVVIDQETGFLIEPGDQPALTEAITKLVDSPELCADMGTRALARIQERFEVSRVVDAYMELYGKALGQPIEEIRRRAA
jgi:glycosyltransferase involved in cell wall biosynthesis